MCCCCYSLGGSFCPPDAPQSSFSWINVELQPHMRPQPFKALPHLEHYVSHIFIRVRTGAGVVVAPINPFAGPQILVVKVLYRTSNLVTSPVLCGDQSWPQYSSLGSIRQAFQSVNMQVLSLVWKVLRIHPVSCLPELVMLIMCCKNEPLVLLVTPRSRTCCVGVMVWWQAW